MPGAETLTLTSRERILRTIRRAEVDRVPVADKPWGPDTLARWMADGMPNGVDYQDYFGFDKMIRFEVKAGLDPLAIKREFGDTLTLHGGVNALLWNDLEAMEAVVREQVPALKEGGGFIFATDHSIPTNVSVADLQHILTVVRDAGQY